MGSKELHCSDKPGIGLAGQVDMLTLCQDRKGLGNGRIRPGLDGPPLCHAPAPLPEEVSLGLISNMLMALDLWNGKQLGHPYGVDLDGVCGDPKVEGDGQVWLVGDAHEELNIVHKVLDGGYTTRQSMSLEACPTGLTQLKVDPVGTIISPPTYFSQQEDCS